MTIKEELKKQIEYYIRYRGRLQFLVELLKDLESKTVLEIFNKIMDFKSNHKNLTSLMISLDDILYHCFQCCYCNKYAPYLCDMSQCYSQDTGLVCRECLVEAIEYIDNKDNFK